MNEQEKKELIEVVERLDSKSQANGTPTGMAIVIYMDALRKKFGSGKSYTVLEALKKCDERSNKRSKEMEKIREGDDNLEKEIR